jgi:proteasome lid subunit RPN8/RPN11
VRERIELNQNLAPTAVSGDVMHELCSHALDVAPEECCGLVSGTRAERFHRVHRITNIMTKKHATDPLAFSRDAHHAYYMSEVEYLRAQKDVEARGQRITAVYHSHVGTASYLSEEDLAYAEHSLFPFPGVAQIVMSVVGDRVDAPAIFEMDRTTGRFTQQGRLLEVLVS